LHQILHVCGSNVEQFDAPGVAFPQARPIEIAEGMLALDLTDNFIRNPRPLSQPRQVKLLHLASTAHAVHRRADVAFAPDETTAPNPLGPDVA
jgi:hypothetical protein